MNMRIAIVNDEKGNLLVLSQIIEKNSQHNIVWLASDGEEALAKCLIDTPDVILMDLHMPVMNGIDSTKAIMSQCPCAIIIATASVTGNASLVFEAMGAGALDVVKTPILRDFNFDHEEKVILQKIDVIKNLITPQRTSNKPTKRNNSDSTAPPIQKPILVFGASTGGPAVLATVLSQLPANFPIPIVIVQHVDQYFSQNFAEWLDEQCPLSVRIAKNGEIPETGSILIAGTNHHMVIDKHKRLTYTDTDKGNNYKPSVDVFFDSLTSHWDSGIIACLLTGMGRDGAAGLLQIRQKGGYTITQDEDSCAVYGMPKAADDIGASMHSLAPDDIVHFILELLENNNKNTQVEQA